MGTDAVVGAGLAGVRVRPAVGQFDDVAVGTTRLFEAHGFERAAPTTGQSGHRPRWVMRRELG